MSAGLSPRVDSSPRGAQPVEADDKPGSASLPKNWTEPFLGKNFSVSKLFVSNEGIDYILENFSGSFINIGNSLNPPSGSSLQEQSEKTIKIVARAVVAVAVGIFSKIFWLNGHAFMTLAIGHLGKGLLTYRLKQDDKGESDFDLAGKFAIRAAREYLFAYMYILVAAGYIFAPKSADEIYDWIAGGMVKKTDAFLDGTSTVGIAENLS